MAEISLSDILLAREERARLQAEISSRFACPIISFTMNIAGPTKNSPMISRAFRIGLQDIDSQISEASILFKHIDVNQHTGPLAVYAVKEDPQVIKNICVELEEKTALGRLFDLDVIDTTFQKLTRKSERGCIVCGAPGRACAAGRIHAVDEIVNKMSHIMTEGLFEHDSNFIAHIVKESLISEVKTTPKPGLVDLRNCGSHKDMTPETFEKSANSLLSYFIEAIKIGRSTKDMLFDTVFHELRRAGLVAEEQMYNATNGVNTHKGAIFSFGILCGAIGRLWQPELPVAQTDELLSVAAEIAKHALLTDFSHSQGNTAGEKMYLETGSAGIRGEAASGFNSVNSISLPIYREMLGSDFSRNDAGAITLLHLIANVDDTAIYNRGGAEGLSFAKQYAREILGRKKIPRIAEIEDMDDIFIQKNLTAGGSADLLAITYFLYELENLSKYRDQ